MVFGLQTRYTKEELILQHSWLVIKHSNTYHHVTQLGEKHEKTKESGQLVKKLTDEAVKFQKAMNVLSKGGGGPVPHIQVS